MNSERYNYIHTQFDIIDNVKVKYQYDSHVLRWYIYLDMKVTA